VSVEIGGRAFHFFLPASAAGAPAIAGDEQ
jgi:hypothetical protein